MYLEWVAKINGYGIYKAEFLHRRSLLVEYHNGHGTYAKSRQIDAFVFYDNDDKDTEKKLLSFLKARSASDANEQVRNIYMSVHLWSLVKDSVDKINDGQLAEEKLTSICLILSSIDPNYKYGAVSKIADILRAEGWAEK